MVRYALVVLLVLFPQYTFAAGTLVYQGGVVSGPGTGDVVGSASSVDNGLARYDGTTGKLLQGYTSNAPVCGDTGICTFVAPVLGTPTSGVATNLIGLPAASVLAGTLGTGAYVMDTTLTVPTLLGGTATTSDLNLKTTSGAGAAGADMHFLVGNNGATEAITILNSGKVGIGTAAPITALQVGAGNTAADTAVAKFNTFDANVSALEVSNWDGAAATYGPRIQFDNSGVGTWYIGSSDGANNFDIAQTWGTPRLRVTSTGVGIGGATSPGQTLSVAGTLGILEGGASPSLYTIFQGGDQAANLTYTLPTAQGAANTSLTNNGSGVLSWAAAGSTITAATATVATSETTASVSYTDLATSGPAVTVTIGPSGILLVGVKAEMQDNSAGQSSFMSFALSGGNTLAADDARAFAVRSVGASEENISAATFMRTGLAASSTVITAKYRVSAGTGTFRWRDLWVMTW